MTNEQCVLKISGLPANNTMLVNHQVTLFPYICDLSNSVQVEWSYDPNMICLTEGFMYHSFMATLTAMRSGITTVTAKYGTQIYSFTLTINKLQIYLSPANHRKRYTKLDGTIYPVAECNEKKNLEAIATLLKEKLDKYCVDVIYTDVFNSNEQYTGRPADAYEKLVDKDQALYLALHSNADANGSDSVRGSIGFYNGLRESGSLALAFVDAIDPILPNGSNRSSRTQEINGLSEMIETRAKDITAILLEIGFHDNPLEANFLINNELLIAETLCNTLIDFYSLVRK